MAISNTLKVTLLQANLVWENPTENLMYFEKEIEKVTATDLIILPEMFTTGFTMNVEKVAETMYGKTVKWMQKVAAKKQVAICGSVIITEENKFYNRFLFVHPSGKIEYYDKRHTFTLAGEHEVFSEGKKQLILEYKGWQICPLICYDLRFPVWARNTKNYDLLIYVANWPKQRITAWDTLLKARAIENMSYTIGVNRVGKDANNHKYTGNSAVVDCLGNVLDCFDDEKPKCATFTLDKKHQNKTRNKLRFLDDKDTFKIL